MEAHSQHLPEIKILADVVYAHKDGMALTMDVYLPADQNECGVVFINSGGFHSPFFACQCKNPNNESSALGVEQWMMVPKNELNPAFMQQVSFEQLLKNGYTVFDVRHSSAPRYMLDEILTDLHHAISYIKTHSDIYQVSRDRLGIWGGSAGGYLSAYLAANPQYRNELQAVVLYYPSGYDFLASRNDVVREQLPALHIPDQKLDSLSLKHYISMAMPPTLIMYGALDQPFITEPSEALFNDLEKYRVPCRKIVFENTGHIWLNKEGVYDSETGEKAMDNLVKWFDAHL